MSNEQDLNPFDHKESALLHEAFSLTWKLLSDTKAKRLREGISLDHLVGALMSIALIGGLDAPEIARRTVDRYLAGQF
jgi:hypothetical protein